MSDYRISDVFYLLWPDFGALFAGQLEGTATFIVLIIWAISLWFLSFALVQRKRASRRISQVRSMLANVKTDELADKRPDIQRQAEEADPRVKHLWREFDETLVASPDGKSLWNTLDAEHFFNSQSLAPRLMHNRILAVVPSALTAIGVLGTFIGLTTGLSGLGLQTGSSVEELSAGIDHLIGAAAVAFMTSVWGVGFSLFTNIAEKFMERGVARQIAELQHHVDELFKRHAPEQSLVEIMDSSQETSLAMQELHEKVGNRLQEAVEGISSDLQTALTGAIETAMAPSMTALVEQTTNQSTEVFEQLVGKFTASFEQIGSTQAQRLDAASEGLTASLKSFSDHFSDLLTGMQESVQEQRAAATEQASQFTEQLSQLTALSQQQSELLGSSLSRLLSELDTATARISATAENLATAAGELDGSAATISQSATSLQETLLQSTEMLTTVGDQHAGSLELLEAHAGELTKLQAATEDAGNRLSTAAQNANEGFTSLRGHQREFLDDLKSRVEDLNGSMSTWLEDYAEKVRRQTGERMDVWNEHSRTYASHMLQAAQALSEVVDEMGGNGRANESTISTA